MAYLAKGNKPDLLSVCEEMGAEVDQSSKVVDIKKLILNSQFYVEEEVKIILDRVISDRKEQERGEGRIRAQVPKKDWVAYLLAVLPAELSNMLAREPTEKANNYYFVKDLILKSCRPKETPKDFKSNFQIKREPAHEKSHEKDFEKRRQLRCYECGSYLHLRPQFDKLKKTPESISRVVTDKSFDELMARYTSLGKVNGVEMKILRDTEVELDCEMGHVITKAAVLRDSLDQGRYLLGKKTAALLEDYKTKEDVQMHMINSVQTRAQTKLLEVENEVQGQSIEQFDEELNDDLSEDEKKTIEEVWPVVKELSARSNKNVSKGLCGRTVQK
ncbi:SCAN box domain-containing protein [Trichonephila inaurata madagascariensis]|uniref:SCAN box domain-containing protein n=1 Tax=Trichonephila inaurata madagascariensis TaxID=2747483 RepID=A0A8X6XLZ5_9ARAC|nr:SCAN box domain-containing protein [Trichonephila inaurata madagascariensis]